MAITVVIDPYEIGTAAAVAIAAEYPSNAVLRGFTRREAEQLFRGHEPARMSNRRRRSWRRSVSRRLVSPTLDWLVTRRAPAEAADRA